jgi:glycerol kinase
MSGGSYLLALDQGTSSSRAIVFERGGRLVAQAQAEFTQHFPQSGWVEHDLEEIWQTQLGTAQAALRQAGLQARDVAAIGITNQRETTCLWDRRTGRPLHRAIVWQDRRTEPLCQQLRAEGLAARLRERTGLVVDPYFSGTKLAWLLDHLPGARAAAERGELAFGTVDSWLLWRLTGGRVHASDASNAARTLLFDIHRDAWDDTLLQRLQIPAALLPAVHPSAHRYGETDAALFGAPIPITGVAGDQQAALFGQACFRPGLAKNTYGTGCFMLLATGAEARDSQVGLLTTRAAQTGAARRSTRWRAACSSAARWCSGCATAWAPSAPAATSRRWPPASATAAASASCRPSPAWARPTGTPTRAAPSSACRAAARWRTSRAPRWRASRCRAPCCCRP